MASITRSKATGTAMVAVASPATSAASEFTSPASKYDAWKKDLAARCDRPGKHVILTY